MIPQEIACWLPPISVFLAMAVLGYAKKPWQAKAGIAAAAILLALGASDGLPPRDFVPPRTAISEGAK